MPYRVPYKGILIECDTFAEAQQAIDSMNGTVEKERRRQQRAAGKKRGAGTPARFCPQCKTEKPANVFAKGSKLCRKCTNENEK